MDTSRSIIKDTQMSDQKKTAREVLLRMRGMSADLPEDFLRDLAGSARSKILAGDHHKLTSDEAEILDAIADTWESARIRIEKAQKSLSVEPI